MTECVPTPKPAKVRIDINTDFGDLIFQWKE